ncbi:MAG TPA: sigma 54-interacting transcriptional regulator [Bryobacteraceae bacterium]|nr:sigma 54-interacting transcriptional regulator [Bryobacteraceae bacterium]
MSARILIVEDERITAEDLRDILTDLGYTVTASVSSGAEAIARAEDTTPDLALMDIRIKGQMDGTETARILRERFNIPVIYLTAHADSATVARAKDAEPLGYITKPFQEAELHASIEIALHKHREDLKFREKERLLASTLRAVSEGVISLDQNEIITLFNPAAEAWTGWKARDALGKHIDEVLTLVDSATGEKVHTPLWRVLAEGALAELPPGVLLVPLDGQKRPITGSMSPIRDHKGEVAGAVVVFGRAGESPVASAPTQSGTQSDDDGIGLGSFKMVAASPAMKQALKFARRVAQSEVSTILLEGESGTGKDVLAQFIHHYGRRSDGPFVALNCAAIPETLLESELFGYEKGAFTDARAPKAGILEVASGGTVFLDEIGEMPLVIQAKLLRVLEEQNFRRLGGVRDIQVDLRVVAATNRKLTEAIEQGRFRLDLYYRLNVIQVVLPPLRERAEDVIPLAEHFVRMYNTKFKRHVKGISHSAAAALLAHDWPGNVRELRNVIERAMVLEEADWIQASNLQIASDPAKPPLLALEQSASADDQSVPVAMPAQTGPFEVSLEEAEKNLVKKALERAGGNQTRAAVLLGVTRDTLRYKMKKFNLR